MTEDQKRQVVELWVGGMSLYNVAIAIGRKTTESVSKVIDRYANRERVYSKDGRSWCYRRLREIHPDAPLSDDDIQMLWPSPERGDCGDEDADAAAQRVLDAVDYLNDAIESLCKSGDWSWLDGERPARRVVLNLHGGRIYAAIDHHDRSTEPSLTGSVAANAGAGEAPEGGS